MSPLYSVLHATYMRPDKAFNAMQLWLARSGMSLQIEYIFAVNADDPSADKLTELLIGQPCKVVMCDYKGSSEAWDAAARVSKGKVLIQAQDDVEPPHGWGQALLNFYVSHSFGPAEPTFIAVSDGYRKDKLCCTAIMNRARYEQQGEFLHGGYISVFSDDEVTIRAYADAADGKCTLIEARHLVFKHEHACHNPAVPMDETYQRENRQDAYAQGVKLFTLRNADALQRGFRKW